MKQNEIRRATPAMAWMCAALLGMTATSASARSSGPPDGRTGAPGELTCATSGCHGTASLNTGSGSLVISAPETYAPDQTYSVEVTLDDPEQTRWGFELTVLDGNNDFAGTIVVTDPDSTQTSVTSGKTYIKHTSAGTRSGTSGPRTWSFDWTAPASEVGTVTFYAAGNAANGNFSNSGDHIYTAQASVGPAPTAIAPHPEPAAAKLGANFPNPFNPSTTIPFSVDRAGQVRIAVYSLSGQLQRVLTDAAYQSGEHAIEWDGTDNLGMSLASGVYIVTMEAGAVNQARAVVLAR